MISCIDIRLTGSDRVSVPFKTGCLEGSLYQGSLYRSWPVLICNWCNSLSAFLGWLLPSCMFGFAVLLCFIKTVCITLLNYIYHWCGVCTLRYLYFWRWLYWWLSVGIDAGECTSDAEKKIPHWKSHVWGVDVTNRISRDDRDDDSVTATKLASAPATRKYTRRTKPHVTRWLGWWLSYSTETSERTVYTELQLVYKPHFSQWLD